MLVDWSWLVNFFSEDVSPEKAGHEQPPAVGLWIVVQDS